MKRLIYFLAVITLFNSCSKEDPIIEPEESFIEGGIIKKLSLVKINNEHITQEQYDGKFGNIELIFYKTAEKELTFTVPNASVIGENILEITSLNNLKIKYEVEDTVLEGTPEENISSYFVNVNNYLPTANDANNVFTYFESLHTFFQNSSEDDKVLMAKFYKANQAQFDAILNKDFLNKSFGKTSADVQDIKILLKYITAVLTCGVSTAIAILNPEPVTKAIAAGIAIVAFDIAADLKKDFANRNILKLNVIIDGLSSELASKGLKKSELIAYNEIERSFVLQSQSRALISADSNNINENVSKFFANQDLYNSAIEKINTAIKFVNDNLFFSNISLLEVSSLNDSQSELIENASSLFFSNAAFTIESDNITIQDLNFNNGKLNLKVKIKDESSVNEFVETKLNYNYQDDFNEISGSLPLKIYISKPQLKPGYYELTYSWEEKKVLFHLSNNSNTTSFGDIYYWDSSDNYWFDPSFSASFSAYYDKDSNNKDIVRISVSTGGCLSEGFRIEDFNPNLDNHNGIYTSARCYYSDKIGDAVTLKYIGETVLNIK